MNWKSKWECAVGSCHYFPGCSHLNVSAMPRTSPTDVNSEPFLNLWCPPLQIHFNRNLVKRTKLPTLSVLNKLSLLKGPDMSLHLKDFKGLSLFSLFLSSLALPHTLTLREGYPLRSPWNSFTLQKKFRGPQISYLNVQKEGLYMFFKCLEII